MKDARSAEIFSHDESLLMFPPSPEHSLTGSSCNSWVSEVDSPALSAQKISSNIRVTKFIKWVRKEKIGQGAQGTIYRCEDPSTNREVAVKVIWTKELPPPAVEAVKREVKTMQRLRHRHLVRYFQATEKKQRELRIYMEYAAGGSLSSQLSRSGALSVALVQRYTRQLCEAVHYLHHKGIAHRDIKCANILLTTAADGICTDVKLADFGTFKVVGCASLVGGLKGTPHWMAPEVIRHQNIDDQYPHERWFRADVWSLGCAVLEMITGHSPWQQYSNPLTAMYQIVSSEETPTIPSNVPAEIAAFLNLCLQRNPEQRGTINQLLAHPFVRVANDRTSRARNSKHCIKRRNEVQVDKVTLGCNQLALSLKPKFEVVPEPESHEDSMTLSNSDSPNRLNKASVIMHPPRSSLYVEEKRTLQPPALYCVRERDMASPVTRSQANRRLPSSRRLKSLEPSNQALLSDFAHQDATSACNILPTIPSSLLRGVSAGSKRLPQLIPIQTGYNLESVSARQKRSATAPTSVIKFRATDELCSASRRLPPLSACAFDPWGRLASASSCNTVKANTKLKIVQPFNE